MAHENTNIGGRAEHPGSDEQKISEMLGSLKRVEAPKDFDFHLKARIANARPVDHSRSAFLPILKYVTPLVLLLVVGAGGFIYNSYDYPLTTETVAEPAAVASAAPPKSTVESIVPASDSGPADTIQNSSESISPRVRTGTETEIASERPHAPQRTRPDERLSSVPDGPRGSRDFGPTGNFADRGLKPAPTPRTPLGVQLNMLNVDEAFKLIGADARFESGGWSVRAVTAGGIAERIGMRAGDKLKSVDGTPIQARTQFDSKFTARTIAVDRDGSTVDLSLPNDREDR